MGSGQVGRGSICFQHVQDWSKLGSGTLDYFQQRRQKVDQDHPLFDMRIRHNAYSKNIHLVPGPGQFGRRAGGSGRTVQRGECCTFITYQAKNHNEKGGDTNRYDMEP